MSLWSRISDALAALTSTALTANAEGVSFEGNVAVTTDYHWRGVTQSNQDMAIQGGFDLSTEAGFYAGTWLSSVDFLDSTDTNIEWDIYGGYAGEFEGGLGFDVGFISYIYPDSGDADLDFTELYAGLSKDFESGFGLGGTLYWDPDNETVYAEAGAGFGVNDYLSIDANVGTYLDGFDEYTNYNLGATVSVEGFDLDLRWYDNDQDGADDNIVFSIGRAM